MFLSRTVAAEICMEAKSNESAYRALKALDRSGELLFKLGYVPSIDLPSCSFLLLSVPLLLS